MKAPAERTRGRPPIAPEARRTHHRATRLDDAELAALADLAAQLGTTEADVLRRGIAALRRRGRS